MREGFTNRILNGARAWVVAPAEAGEDRNPAGSVRTVDVLIARVLELLVFTVPLYFLGVQVAGYDFSLATLLIIVLAALLVYRGEFIGSRSFVAALFVGWCLFTAIGRHGPLTYLPSLAALVLVVTPLCTSLPRTVRPARVLTMLLAGFIVSLVFAAWDIAFNLIGVPAVEQLIPVGLVADVQTQVMLGFRRVKASMAEPAHYALYLVAVIVVVDQASRRGFRIAGEAWIKIAASLALLSTLSLSGFLLLAGYLFLRVGRGLWESLRSLEIPRSTLPRGLAALGLLVLLAVAGRWLVTRIDPALFDLVFGRIDRVIYVVQNAVYRGSEGSRANAIPVMIDYWTSQGLDGVLVGEGYARYQGWLASTFARWEYSTLAQGRLANVLAILGISTGVVGLVLYLGFVGTVALDSGRRLPAAFVAVWLGMHFAYGFLIGYLLWSLLLVGQVVLGRPAGAPAPHRHWRIGLIKRPVESLETWLAPSGSRWNGPGRADPRRGDAADG